MKRVIQEHLIDCSDPDKFVYNLICPECGKLWQSTPVPFSKAGQAPQTESKKVIFYRMSGKNSGLSPGRWRKPSIVSICARYVSVWCATIVS